MNSDADLIEVEGPPSEVALVRSKLMAMSTDLVSELANSPCVSLSRSLPLPNSNLD